MANAFLCPVFALCPPALVIQMCTTVPNFYVRARDSSSGPYALYQLSHLPAPALQILETIE